MSTAGTGAPETVEDQLSCDTRQISSSELLNFVQNGSSNLQATMYVLIPFYIIIFFLFFDLMIFHIRYTVSWKRTRYTLWVVSVFPVHATTCFIGIYMPNALGFVGFVRSFYFAIVLVKFFKLIMHLYGGKKQAVIALKGDEVVSANPFPCCFICCCHNQPMTESRINKLRWIFYQVFLVYPICYFFQTLIAADGLTLQGAIISFVFELIAATSGLTCLYGFVVLGKSANYALQEFLIRGKYISISLIVLFDTLQDFLILLADIFGGLQCGFPYPHSQRAKLWHSYILFFEIFLLSCMGWYCFRISYVGKQVHIKKVPISTHVSNISIEEIKSPFPDSSSSSSNSSDFSDGQHQENRNKYTRKEMTV